MKEHIKEYTKRGFVVHPLSSPTDTGKSPGKRPLLKGWQLLQKTPDLAAFPEGCNIGLVCGRASGVTVIDYDSWLFFSGAFAGDGVDTLSSRRTPWRGHLYLKYAPDIKSQKHSLLGMEVLNDGSNAVLPPSVHKSGEIYRWINQNTPLAEMPESVRNNLLALFGTETELKRVLSRCRPCFKHILKGYPESSPDVSGADGRQFMLALCTDLKALGAKERHIKMLAKLLYRQEYDDEQTEEEFKHIDASKTWRCTTLRDKLPTFVNCGDCVFTSTPARMKVNIPPGVREVTLVIENETAVKP